jgi:hypothetical protein
LTYEFIVAETSFLILLSSARSGGDAAALPTCGGAPEVMTREGLTQAQAAKRLGVVQPRISEIATRPSTTEVIRCR